jgi:hypothetical protein
MVYTNVKIEELFNVINEQGDEGAYNGTSSDQMMKYGLNCIATGRVEM